MRFGGTATNHSGCLRRWRVEGREKRSHPQERVLGASFRLLREALATLAHSRAAVGMAAGPGRQRQGLIGKFPSGVGGEC